MSEAPSAPAHVHPIAIAPALNGRAEAGDSGMEHMPYTCVACARRKVKCDKLIPTCSTCKKGHQECIYAEPPPRKKKRKQEDDIYARLLQYENLLKQNGLLPPSEQATPNVSVPSDSSPLRKTKTFALSDQPNPGKLLRGDGKSRYIDSGIWRKLGEHDFHPSSDEEEEEFDDQTTTGYPSTSLGDPVSGALLGPGSPPSNLIASHPTYESAMKLWSIYVENIDPLVKVVHVPSGRVMLQRAAANPSGASKATEALLFAIYHFALVSISEQECQKLFGEPLSVLIRRYHDAVRLALVNAYFLRTTDHAVLQAYVLFLLSVRNVYDPHTFWILTGVAIRIGQRMGMHRDGEAQGLNPYDVQMRRRIFWQMLPLDGLAFAPRLIESQLCGTGIALSLDSWDTKQPLNINDDDIWPDMEQAPEPRTGATDIMFCLARTEMAKLIKAAKPTTNLNWERIWDGEEFAEKERQLAMLEQELEVNYLRYCDFANPLHNVVQAMARTAINAGKLRIRLPIGKRAHELLDEERREIWTIANRMLESDIAVHNNLTLSRFLWHLRAFFQWDPLIWILNEIRRDPVDYQDDQVWDRIEKIYTNHPSMLTQRRALHLAVGLLTLKAWAASQSNRAPTLQAAEVDPYFITSLRAFTSKRSGSRSSSSAPTTAFEYNAFNPMDNSEDFGASNFSNMAWNTNDIDFSRMADLSTDSQDWMFWDQLIRHPNYFPTS